MWVELIGYVATPVLTALVMWWLLRSGTDPAPVEDGALVLRYPRSFAWFGVVILAVGVVLAVLVARSAGEVAPPTLLAVVLVIGLPGLSLVVIQQREQLRVTLDGLEARDVLGRTRLLRWAEVERVTFSTLASALTFHSAYDAKLRASGFYIGIVTLADLVERRLVGEGGAGAVRQLRESRGLSDADPKR